MLVTSMFCEARLIFRWGMAMSAVWRRDRRVRCGLFGLAIFAVGVTAMEPTASGPRMSC